MDKIETARQEYKDWCKSINISTIDQVNEALEKGYGIQLINLCEARQERQYADIADRISEESVSKRIVMMSGPSSSGKTSTSLRIAYQCGAIGVKPCIIELDNYFVNREDTPRDENGEYDFECLGAMDVKLLNEHLNTLLNGGEVEVPHYDFNSGKRTFSGTRVKLDQGDVLFMEGIHALNPALTPGIDQNKIFRIYISALSALNGGETFHNSTTDKRLLRRIVRDNRVRGNSPEQTILRWPSVRRGEINNIFPYEHNADAVFNSSTLYDIPLLKYYAEPLLYGIAESSPAYGKARELLTILDKFTALTPAQIAAVPSTSIMREFIGGQTLA